MKLKTIGVSLLFAFLLVACGDTDEDNTVQESDIENMKELVQEYSTGNFEDETASITSTQLIVTENDENETVYELPEEEFFVSIAPYINETHPCTNHSLTGCQGEMVEEEFDVYIEDTEGNVVVDETLSTMENGFFDLWLPRDKTYSITIKQDGKVVESEFSTFENDCTCITTLQLL
ncbi:hypothetical protein GMD78_17520 [Ornithinibacillus sp. L9]|uniref:Lipoprotein n=1 Tax=Ornithinibacillus caprae TaxID=2678566 RepID=A0A6N8FL35_9BACI|nr:CueP family metal-binding protein [Ornithinibacillus caprae]MUK90175.1 hypothetical protein [Ornithinibacillus caprae]